MLELKNMSGVITNSSSEVYVFDNMDSEFSKFIKDYSGELNFLKLSTKEDVDRIMTSPVAQEKLLEYCDLPVGWLGMSQENKEIAYQKLLGKTFLFNYTSDPEESKYWYPSEDDYEVLKGLNAKEVYVG